MSRKTNTTTFDINPGYLLNCECRNSQESVVIPALLVGAVGKMDYILPQTIQGRQGHAISISSLMGLLKATSAGHPLAIQPLQKPLVSCSCWKAELAIQKHISKFLLDAQSIKDKTVQYQATLLFELFIFPFQDTQVVSDTRIPKTSVYLDFCLHSSQEAEQKRAGLV